MAGILKLHCTVATMSQLGHSWIEYCPIDGQPHTYSTWGNNPYGRGSGLLMDIERGYQSDVSRTCMINDMQERKLQERIRQYRLLGEHAWKLLAPCSAFAADVWAYTTGERLIHRAAFVSNPTTLANAIRQANAADTLSGRIPNHQQAVKSPHQGGALRKHRKRSALRR